MAETRARSRRCRRSRTARSRRRARTASACSGCSFTRRCYDAFRQPHRRARRRVSRAGSSLDEDVDVCPMIHGAQQARARGIVGSRGREDGARSARRRHAATARSCRPTMLEDVAARNAPRLRGGLRSGRCRSTACRRSTRRSRERTPSITASTPPSSPKACVTRSTAVRRLAVGAVIVNDSTDYRLDVMPFGGTKKSGIGREGIRFACEEMTETRVVCFNL